MDTCLIAGRDQGIQGRALPTHAPSATKGQGLSSCQIGHLTSAKIGQLADAMALRICYTEVSCPPR